MEALAAVGLASNILQFIDFGTTLISESREIYQSVSGLTQEFENLQNVCDYVDRISAGLVPATAAGSFPTSGSGRKPIKAEDDLFTIAQKCRDTADVLHNKLSKLSIGGSSSHGNLSSFKQALKSSLGKSGVKELSKTLDGYRNDLMLCLATVTTHKQSSLIQYLEELKQANLNQVRDHGIELNRVLALVQDVHDQSKKIVASEDENEVLLKSLKYQLDEITTVSNRQWILEHRIAESLYYDTIMVRHESIPEAHINTFSWLLEPKSKKKAKDNESRPKVTFLKWLNEGSRLYWISGKPGSGKSTLMKFVADHRQTQVALSQWTGIHECITVAYYFWSAGTKLQKSLEGLLRSLLFDILTRKPELMRIAVPQRWNNNGVLLGAPHRFMKPRDFNSWTVSEMTTAINLLGSDSSLSYRFCFFIDGLDEYHGDPLDIIKTVQSLSEGQNFKLCVSSRPWNIFEDSIGVEPSTKLYIHELTLRDIQEYTSSTLGEDSNWKAGALLDPRYETLIKTITKKAQGVFLWVVLVVRSVLEGVSDGDSIQMLQHRIDQIPRELAPFFRRILSSVSRIHHKQMAVYFRIAQNTPHALTLMNYSFLDQCIESYPSAFEAQIQPMDNHDIFFRHSTMRRRLNARCKGLLEAYLVPSESRSYMAHRVTFLHRTVRDFFMTDEMVEFLDAILDDYSINTTMLTAYLGLMKSLPLSAPSPLEEAYFYAAKAELESPSDAIAAIDELHGVAIKQGRFTEESKELVQLPVQYGLCEYVSACIGDEIVGFEDHSKLLGYAMESTVTAATEQTDKSKMIAMLLSKGAKLRRTDWEAYVDELARLIRDVKNNTAVMARHEAMLKLLLPATKGPDFGKQMECWGAIMAAVVLKNWESFSKDTGAANVQIVETFLNAGADPNAPFKGTTLWVWLSKEVRVIASSNRRRYSPATRGSLPPEMLGRLLEAMVAAGADIKHPIGLKESDIAGILPRRLANRVIKIMKDPSSSKPLVSGAKGNGWLSWIGSLAWGANESP